MLQCEDYFFVLFSLESIKILRSPKTAVDLQEGDTLELCVEATGKPRPRYQWFFCRDGQDQFQRLTGRTEATLKIHNVTYVSNVGNTENT